MQTPKCFVCFAAIFFFSGCVSTQRSNTQQFKEHVSMVVVPYDPLPPIEKFATSSFVDAAFKIIGGLIKSGAKKYESTATAKTEANLAPGQAGLWMFIRTVESNDKRLLPYRPADIQNDFFAVVDHKPSVRVLQNNIKRLTDSVNKYHRDQKLTFCAVGVVEKPRSDGYRRLTMSAYTYPSAKAKNFPFPLPWLKIHQTESVFSINLQTPTTASGAAFEKTVLSHKFKWDKYNVGWIRPSDDKGDPIVSGPIDFQTHRTITFTGTLVESSDMKKRLDEVGEAVKGIKL